MRGAAFPGVLRRPAVQLFLTLAAGFLVFGRPVGAEELSPPIVIAGRPPLANTLPSVPQEFEDLAPLLHRLVGVIQSLADTQAELKQLRTEVDELTTKLAAVDSELTLVDRERQQLSSQLSAQERQREQRLAALRKDLEDKLSAEFAAGRQQITQEAQHDFEQNVQSFETRQAALIGKTLDHEVALEERELDQLSEEINLQTQELLDRLAKLEANPELAKSLERSTSQVLEKRRAELNARRAKLVGERDAILARERNDFTQTLSAQRNADLQRRLTFKEAGLRSAMADLLHKSEREESGKLSRIQQALEQAEQRHNKVVQQQALLRARTEEMERQLAAKIKNRESFGAQRHTAAAQFEQALQKTGPDTIHPDALAWLGRSIRYLPPVAAAELVPMQQRLVAAAEQEERLREQRRIVRERQQALQLSREMAEQHRKIEERQQREQQVRSRSAEDLLAKADRFAAKGQFDQALELLAQAQAINPPQLDRIALMREQLIATKTQREREQQTAELDGMFRRAKTAFDAGRYEESVALFEQVIAHEAALGQPSSVSATAATAMRGAVLQ